MKVLLLLVAVVAGGMFTSCEDEPDKYEIAEGLPYRTICTDDRP